MNLISERLTLRHLKQGDEIAIFNNWATDPEVTKYMTWNPHKSIEETKMILNIWLNEYNDPTTVRFGITLTETGELIGAIDVVGFVDGCPVIGYCLSRKHWNKGYMSEACALFIKHLHSLGYKTLLIEADVNNIGSNRVIEKCGFKFVEQKRKERCSMFKDYPVVVNCYRM